MSSMHQDYTLLKNKNKVWWDKKIMRAYDIHDIKGNAENIEGDISYLIGDVTGFGGNCSNLAIETKIFREDGVFDFNNIKRFFNRNDRVSVDRNLDKQITLILSTTTIYIDNKVFNNFICRWFNIGSLITILDSINKYLDIELGMSFPIFKLEEEDNKIMLSLEILHSNNCIECVYSKLTSANSTLLTNPDETFAKLRRFEDDIRNHYPLRKQIKDNDHYE